LVKAVNINFETLNMSDQSVTIGQNTGSPIVTGSVGGNVENKIENSFNTYTEQQKQSLAEAAAEIQALLKQLEQSYSTDTTTGKMTIATKAIKHIDNDPKLTQRILSALKAGGISALEQLLNHPAASFFIGALEDWQQTKGS
jgi:phosphoenolpyruvate-protein kinase (PTS system EI component)